MEKATYTMNGRIQEVGIITEYLNGYFWIEMISGETKIVHKTYIRKI